MDIEDIKKYLKDNKEPAFRLQQIEEARYKNYILNFKDISNLPKALAKKLDDKFNLFPFKLISLLSSEDERAHKALLQTEDGKNIETVLLSSRQDSYSACLSSQVGCALDCKFCATGEMGFSRNLTPEEINGQYLFWKNYFQKNKLKGNFTNIIFMGMGEPFLNWDNLKIAINELNNPKKYNLGSRHISISTSGIVPKIKELAKTFPQINLAVSLIFPEQKQRKLYMPVAKTYDLRQLRSALEYYLKTTKRKVFLEYVMFEDLNDNQSSFLNLVEFIKSIENWQKLIQVNLIPYNQNDKEIFLTSSIEKIQAFKKELEKRRIKVSIRKSLGQDIQGACGQLAGKEKQ